MEAHTILLRDREVISVGRRSLYGSATLGTSLLLKACGGGGGDTTATAPTTAASPAASPVAAASGETIKVGILHSLSGTMAISETTVVDAEKLAIKEIIPLLSLSEFNS
jgi:urea transport system substrate-binding protein